MIERAATISVMLALCVVLFFVVGFFYKDNRRYKMWTYGAVLWVPQSLATEYLSIRVGHTTLMESFIFFVIMTGVSIFVMSYCQTKIDD